MSDLPIQEGDLGTSWHSYPSIFNVGHKILKDADFFSAPVLVQEKVDGSQFSFGFLEDGLLKMRSKGATIHAEGGEPKMFKKACDTVRALEGKLTPGWTYRGEVLDKPKHNTLTYERVPKGNVILFDINDGEESYLPYEKVVSEGERLGLEVVPLLANKVISSSEEFGALLESTSVLGGVKVEGVVCKRYDVYGPDRKVLMAKFVSEAFKEAHKRSWNQPGPGDIVSKIIEGLRTEARFQKAVQHLRDDGKLLDDPKDIGPLMKEIHLDIEKECLEDIKEALLTWALPNIKRGVAGGIPEWYKERLLKAQFERFVEEATA